METEGKLNGEPILAPITDFVIKNIDDYKKLDPKESFLRDDAFRQELVNAMGKTEKFQTGRYEQCSYYVAYLDVRLDDQPVCFAIKLLHNELQDKFDELIDQYEALENYCPNITLPTIFLSAKVAGRAERKMSIQKDINNGLTLQDYVDSLNEKGKKVPVSIKKQAQELLNGANELLER